MSHRGIERKERLDVAVRLMYVLLHYIGAKFGLLHSIIQNIGYFNTNCGSVYLFCP